MAKDEKPKKDEAAAPKKIRVTIPDQLAEQMQTSYKRCREAETDYLVQVQRTKDAKARWEGLEEDHRILQHQAYYPPEERFELESEPDSMREPENLAEAAPEDDAWKGADLRDLGIPQRLLNAMREHVPSIVTLGQLAEFTTKKNLTEIAGIGAKSADEIADLTAAYFEKQRRKAAKKADPKPADPPDAKADPKPKPDAKADPESGRAESDAA